MSGNIKGITISFEGDTTKLDQALRKIQNNTKSLDRELKQVDKALKFNPTNVELWRQKQQLLTQKVDETKKKLDALKQAQAQMDAQGVDKNSEEYRKLQRDIIVTENQVKNFEGQLRKIGNVNLRATSEQFKEMGNKLTQAGEAMRGLSMAAEGVADSIGALTVKSAKWADDVVTASKVYSMSTRELQKYNAAADLVDVSADAIAKTHRKLERNMLNAQLGSEKQAMAFKELGIEYQNADGTLRDGDKVWTETIEALSKMKNETERDAYAMALMGRSATELNPLIEDGAEGYRTLTEAMEKYDLDFIDEETLQKANDFNDQLDTMRAVGMIAFQTIGAELAGYLVPAMEKVVGWVGKLANWLSTLDPAILTTISVIAGVVAAIAPVLMFLGKLSFAISSIMSLASTIGPMLGALVTGPVGIVIGVIAALIAIGVLLYKNWDTIKAKAAEIKANLIATWNSIKTSVVNTINTLKNTITSVFSSIKSTAISIWNGIKTAIVSPISNAYNTVKGWIDKIKNLFPLKVGKIFTNLKVPHIKVSGGKAPFGIGGKGSAPSINVDWYAQGGIFTRPTLLSNGNRIAGVGEAGPEAVLPISKLQEMVDFGNAPGNAIMQQQTRILLAIYEELQKEKNFKVDGIWAGRYVNSLVR